jgi:carboxylesterase type B
MGQSGGGLGIASQMILYDGKKPNFHRACARSIQRSAQFAVGDMKVGTHED